MDLLEPRIPVPVHDAIRDKASVTSIVSLVLIHGVATRDSDGRSLLHFAAACGRADVIGALSASADGSAPAPILPLLDALDDGGMTPLQSAVAAGHVAAARALLSAGARVDARSSAGRTALHYTKGRTEVLALLLPACRDRDVSPSDDLGHTPLHRAAAQGHLPAVSALVAAGASLDAVDKTGRTPLHAACEEAREDVATALIAAGASAEAVDRDNATPLELFQEKRARDRLVAAVKALHPHLR